MPGRNIYKQYLPDSYYHIYNRGVNKQAIFVDEQDYIVFLSLLKRYLGTENPKLTKRDQHPNFRVKIELLAFCLMPNHYHLFIYQKDPDGMKSLLKSLAVAYSMYFNKRYKRVGPLFQQRYRAVQITDDSQLLHISRYIHLNPKDYQRWRWSSLPYYTAQKQADWISTKRVLEQFSGTADYLKFLAEYEGRRDELKALKTKLADG